MSPFKKWWLIPFLLAASLLLLTSCGGGSESKAPGEEQPDAAGPGRRLAGRRLGGVDAGGARAWTPTRLEDVGSYCEDAQVRRGRGHPSRPHCLGALLGRLGRELDRQ